MSLDRTRGSLPPTPKPDPHSILQDLVSHFPFSGSPCVGLSSKNAPFLLTQAAPACPLHPASGASKLNLSCSYQKPCPGVCAERHFPPLCCKLCRVWISLSLLLGPLFFLLCSRSLSFRCLQRIFEKAAGGGGDRKILIEGIKKKNQYKLAITEHTGLLQVARRYKDTATLSGNHSVHQGVSALQ